MLCLWDLKARVGLESAISDFPSRRLQPLLQGGGGGGVSSREELHAKVHYIRTYLYRCPQVTPHALWGQNGLSPPLSHSLVQWLKLGLENRRSRARSTKRQHAFARKLIRVGLHKIRISPAVDILKVEIHEKFFDTMTNIWRNVLCLTQGRI